MIKSILEAVYRRTLGPLRNLLVRVAGYVMTRGGMFQVLYLLLMVALMGGFVNAVFFPVPTQGAYYPGPGAMTIPEAFIDSCVILLGGAGIYLAYVSGRQTTRSRMVNLYLSMALLLIVVSLLTGVYMSGLKL